jgi:hypothetical protein
MLRHAIALAALAALPGLAAPTFTKDVLPILQANCQGCHRPGEIAPFSMLSYEATRPWAKSIKTAVVARTMPPWFATEGHFRNDKRLRDASIKTITEWVDAGAPEGNVADAPAPRAFPEGWNIKPDVVVEMPKPFTIAAKGTINYKYYLVKTNFKEDMWISQAEMRPGDKRVLHHGKVWVRPPGSHWMEKAEPNVAYERETQSAIIGNNMGAEGNDILGKFNPGLGAQDFTIQGAAKFIPKGSDLVFELHYTAAGEEVHDASKLGLVLAKSAPQKRYYFDAGPTAMNLAIPPRDGNAEVVSEVTVTSPASLVYAQPHMHLRGKDFELRLVYPTGETQTVLKTKWNFEWQQGFEFDKPIPMPVGTRVVGISHFDNSANNKWNPDPAAKVVWGPQNWDEMSNSFIGVTVETGVDVSKVFKASGPSSLPRGENGPTLSALK